MVPRPRCAKFPSYSVHQHGSCNLLLGPHRSHAFGCHGLVDDETLQLSPCLPLWGSRYANAVPRILGKVRVTILRHCSAMPCPVRVCPQLLRFFHLFSCIFGWTAPTYGGGGREAQSTKRLAHLATNHPTITTSHIGFRHYRGRPHVIACDLLSRRNRSSLVLQGRAM